MSILDITVVNVALPTFVEVPDRPGQRLVLHRRVDDHGAHARARDRHPADRLLTRFGTKRVYMLALALFTAGSALRDGRLDRHAHPLPVRKAGGGLPGLGMTILTKAAGPARMGRLMAILGVPMLLGPIFGPILGGWLIDHYRGTGSS